MQKSIQFVFLFCILLTLQATALRNEEEVGRSNEPIKEVKQKLTTSTTAKPSLPERIRESIYNGIRTLGNAVRYVPATLADAFRNISRTTTEALRRNTTVVLIKETTSTESTTPKAKI